MTIAKETHNPVMTPPAAIIDILNGLLDAEQNSLFRSMGFNSPYLSRATVEMRRKLDAMTRASQRHAAELARHITDLGGDPHAPGIIAEEQYLAYLSLKFFVPKLIDAKRVAIARYENALTAAPNAPESVKQMLASHLGQHREDLSVLQALA